MGAASARPVTVPSDDWPKATMEPIDDAVRLLVEARRTSAPAAAARAPLADAQAAYAVQERVAKALGWFGDAAPRHWKSGAPSREAVLTHAPLPPTGVWASPADAGGWPFRLRGIEAEVALRVGCDVDATLAESLDHARAAALVDAICVSIEIVESRWVEALDALATSKLADLQSHGALVLGPWVPFVARDWGAQVCRVRVGAQPLIERRGTHALADPTFVLPAWLRHATLAWGTVRAGTVVTTGTWVGIVHGAAGELVSVEFPGIGQASVQL